MKPQLVAPIPLRPRDSVIAEIEVMLEAAKRGELIAIGYAGVSNTRKSVTGYVGPEGNLSTLIGGVAILQNRLLGEYEDLSEQ